MKKSTWSRDLLVMLAALCVAGVAVVWVQRITGRIDGVAMLHGCEVRACELRAGAALIVAALSAEGRSEIHNIEYIDRGYEYFEQKLRALGADIPRVEE